MARSQQKVTEDYNVGKAIVQATDTVLRLYQNTKIEDLNCAVIGFGKIGRSIADHCRQKNVKQLLVDDHKQIIQNQATGFGYQTVTKAEIFKYTSMLFIGNGEKSITRPDIDRFEIKIKMQL